CSHFQCDAKQIFEKGPVVQADLSLRKRLCSERIEPCPCFLSASLLNLQSATIGGNTFKGDRSMRACFCQLGTERLLQRCETVCLQHQLLHEGLKTQHFQYRAG